MTEEMKWEYINQLEEEFLQGGLILSEWTTFLTKDAETAFCSNSNLASILACQAAIESHLRFDYFEVEESKGWGFFLLIENSSLPENLKKDLHELRIYRNKWVHVKDPSDDSDLLERPEYHENEILEVAKKSIKTMLKTLFTQPYI
jgi:hypothetical protein